MNEVTEKYNIPLDFEVAFCDRKKFAQGRPWRRALPADRLHRALERKLQRHGEAITAILSAIRELLNRPLSKHRGIGFTADLEQVK